jgi:hypothetical protein
MGLQAEMTLAHSALMFDSWMTRPKLSHWMRGKALKSAPHRTAGYIPWATSFVSTSGAYSAAVNQPARLGGRFLRRFRWGDKAARRQLS